MITPSHSVKAIFYGILDSNMWLWPVRVPSTNSVLTQKNPRVFKSQTICNAHLGCSYRQGRDVKKEPKRPCYDLTAFRLLALPQVDFHKNSQEVVLNKHGDDSRSREWLIGNRRNGTSKKSVRQPVTLLTNLIFPRGYLWNEIDFKFVSKRLATKWWTGPIDLPSTSTDQRLSKLDTRFSRFSRHLLASFLKGVKCWELVSISWSFFTV